MNNRLSVVLLFALLPLLGSDAAAFVLDATPGSGQTTSQDAPAALKAPAATPVSQASVTVPDNVPLQPLFFDYSTNLISDVFGASLFTGAFARQGATQFNPDYVIAINDRIQVRMWGAFEFDALLNVDPQGNIFLPHIGPMKVLGVKNSDLQHAVETSVEKVFRANVYSYASLAAAQPVRVFVSGFVNRPGLYSGTSMSSLLHYLDQAGGIDPERGSFLNVQVKRGEEIRATISLYDFLLAGRIPLIQFADGDVVFVSHRQNTVKVSGLAESAKRFEFSDSARTIADLMKIAKPLAQSTHVRVMRNSGTVKNMEYYPLEDASRVVLQNGDELEFTSDRKTGTITVRVEGEHASSQEYVLPNGSRFGDLIKQIKFSDRSDTINIQLYRQSAKDRQKLMFATALKSLEASVLTARSNTSDEARLRKDEADLILQWIDRAKKVEPSGQVVINKPSVRDALLLENGDLISVPAKDGLVLINGEVLFPTTIMFNEQLAVDEYIQSAGGFTQNANTSRIVIAHRDGSYEDGSNRSIFSGRQVRPGDEILVLPKIDVKSVQIVKDLTQILFQIAVSAKVILGL